MIFLCAIGTVAGRYQTQLSTLTTTSKITTNYVCNELSCMYRRLCVLFCGASTKVYCICRLPVRRLNTIYNMPYRQLKTIVVKINVSIREDGPVVSRSGWLGCWSIRLYCSPLSDGRFESGLGPLVFWLEISRWGGAESTHSLFIYQWSKKWYWVGQWNPIVAYGAIHC